MERFPRVGAALAMLFVALAALVWWRADEKSGRMSPFPAPYPVHGLDVSHHNGLIDWPRVAAGGMQFVWIKATEGGDVVDPTFVMNAAGAQGAKISTGAYHFFTFCRPGADQAQNFLRAISGLPVSIAVDVEFVGNCRNAPGADAIRRELDVFIEQVESASGRKLIVYTTPEADDVLLRGLERERWLRSIPGEPKRDWRYWQFDAAGHVPGIIGPVDLNVRR